MTSTAATLPVAYINKHGSTEYHPFERVYEEDAGQTQLDPYTFRVDMDERDERFNHFNPEIGQRFKMLCMDEDGTGKRWIATLRQWTTTLLI